ncbi:MAG: response regulator [Motiliproteus sp.]
MNQSSAKKQLLLLDDEPNVLKSLVRLLSKDNYEIHTFSRPFDAIEMLKCTDIGVIIVDQCMPQMEGTEFLQQARKIRPEAINIMLTGYDTPENQASADNEKEVFCYLSKPWNDQTLRKTVIEAFDHYAKQQK